MAPLCTGFFALGVILGLAIRGEVPLPLRLSRRAWHRLLFDSQSPQISSFWSGLCEVIPADPFQTLACPSYLEAVICGPSTVDIDQLKACTVYENVGSAMVLFLVAVLFDHVLCSVDWAKG